MPKFTLLPCLALLMAITACNGPDAGPYQPQEALTPLFHDVQMAGIFADSKTFADAVPRQAPDAIAAAYEKAQERTGFSLEDFVYEHFDLPANSLAEGIKEEVPLADTEASWAGHLSQHWEVLSKPALPQNEEQASAYAQGSLLPLPYPYVVPGGRFTEMYYWDSYFTMEGLAASNRTGQVLDMVANFAYLIDTYGHVPNGNRSYYLSRSQPPYFALMVDLVGKQMGLQAAFDYVPQLQREHDFWMAGLNADSSILEGHHWLRLPDGAVLNRYNDQLAMPRAESYAEDISLARGLQDQAAQQALYQQVRATCESGWDFSSRWMGDGSSMTTLETNQLLPIDLNCLLYQLENTLSLLYMQTGQQAMAIQMANYAKRRREALLAYCWDESTGFFYDYHIEKGLQTHKPTLAGVYPLYFGLANASQAQLVAKKLENDFLMPGGLVTTLQKTGQQWDYPNGWAPLQYIAVKGLERYYQEDLAHTVRERWLALNEKVWRQSGKMLEKYNVADTTLPGGGGEYPLQDGFGWTNGVALRFLKDIEEAATGPQ